MLYLDGTQVANSAIGSVIPQTSYNFNLGARTVGSPGNRWFGAIDEVSLYNRALTAAEIATIYHALGNGKCH